MNNYTDIFFIIIFIVVIVILLLFGIIKLIDNRISKVSINIPQAKPKVILNVNETKEGFIVADAQDIHNYDEIKERTLKEKNNFNEEMMKNPTTNKIVDYDKYKEDDDFYIGLTYNSDYPKKFRKEKEAKKFILQHDFGWEPPVNYVGCSNSSIAERYKTGDKQLIPYKVACGHPNKITAENYYLTHYRAKSVPMDNHMVKGFNYDLYATYPTPQQTKNMRILSQNTKGLPLKETQVKNIPMAHNYAFHNTPAMMMP